MHVLTFLKLLGAACDRTRPLLDRDVTEVACATIDGEMPRLCRLPGRAGSGRRLSWAIHTLQSGVLAT